MINLRENSKNKRYNKFLLRLWAFYIQPSLTESISICDWSQSQSGELSSTHILEFYETAWYKCVSVRKIGRLEEGK